MLNWHPLETFTNPFIISQISYRQIASGPELALIPWCDYEYCSGAGYCARPCQDHSRFDDQMTLRGLALTKHQAHGLMCVHLGSGPWFSLIASTWEVNSLYFPGSNMLHRDLHLCCSDPGLLRIVSPHPSLYSIAIQTSELNSTSFNNGLIWFLFVLDWAIRSTPQ